MKRRNPIPRHLPSGQVVAGVAVVIGLAAAVGLVLSADRPDLGALSSIMPGQCPTGSIFSAAL